LTRALPHRARPGAVADVRPAAGDAQGAPLGVALFDLDCRCLWVNDELGKLSGLPAEEHIGLAPGSMPADGVPLSGAQLRYVLETGEARTALEMSGRGADAAPERIRLVTCLPIRDCNIMAGVGAL
jgi:PAS domain-containing protein